MTPAELAEDTLAFVRASPMFEPLEREGYVYVAGRSTGRVTRVRRVDVAAVREEAHARGAARVEWWLGWNAPPNAQAELADAGLVPDEMPELTGMTCDREPPAPRGIEIRAASAEEVVGLERAVWGSEPDPPVDDPVVRHFAAVVDGEAVGVGRSVDMDGGVALMGGVVLPSHRGRGVYRTLVRARWEHAAARGTPLLVVQAGDLSAPVLRGIGFRTHGVVHVYRDPHL